MHKKKYITTLPSPGTLLQYLIPFLNRILPEYEYIISYKAPQLLLLKEARVLQEEHNLHHYQAVIFVPGETLYSKEYCWIDRFCYFISLFCSKSLTRTLFYFLVRRRKDIASLFFCYRRRFSYIEKFIQRSSHHTYSLVPAELREDLRTKNVLSIPFMICNDCALNKHINKAPVVRNQQISSQYKQRKFCALLMANINKLHTFDIYMCLNQYKSVDFYGGPFFAPLGNFPGLYWDSPKCYQSYRFVISTENTSSENYITEKIFRAFEADVIPIYWGAPNIKEYVNEKRFVCAQDYKNYTELRQRIKALDQDHEQYMNMVSQPIFTEQNLENIHKAEKKARDFLLKALENIK